MRSPLLPLSAALLLLCNLAGVALLKDFHYKLHLFNYKARSPTLALCSGVASLVVIDVALVDTLLRSAGGRPLPLPVMLWVSWLSLVSAAMLFSAAGSPFPFECESFAHNSVMFVRRLNSRSTSFPTCCGW